MSNLQEQLQASLNNIQASVAGVSEDVKALKDQLAANEGNAITPELIAQAAAIEAKLSALDAETPNVPEEPVPGEGEQEAES